MVRFLIFQVSEAVRTEYTTRLLSNQHFWNIFWNIPELHSDGYLQFMQSMEIKVEMPFSHSILHK